MRQFAVLFLVILVACVDSPVDPLPRDPYVGTYRLVTIDGKAPPFVYSVDAAGDSAMVMGGSLKLTADSAAILTTVHRWTAVGTFTETEAGRYRVLDVLRVTFAPGPAEYSMDIQHDGDVVRLRDRGVEWRMVRQ